MNLFELYNKHTKDKKIKKGIYEIKFMNYNEFEKAIKEYINSIRVENRVINFLADDEKNKQEEKEEKQISLSL